MEFFDKIKIEGLIMLIVICGLTANSEPIDKNAAKLIASGYAKQMQKSHKKSVTEDTKMEISFEMEGEDQTFYVFNIGDDNGFVVVSGDDATAEILMSCEEGRFTVEEMPENMMAWLNEYSRQIKWLRENGITKEQNQRSPKSFNSYYRLSDDPEKAQRLARWAQEGEFGDTKHLMYNYDFPQYVDDKGNTVTAPTGCTITAVAQLLYYHEWPNEIGPKSIPSYITTTNKTPISGWEKGTEIDWDNIDRTYDTSVTYSLEKRIAISNLMKMVGAAYGTNYKAGGSSASLWRSTSVLRQYFGYKEMEYTNKISDEDKWLKMIYDELRNNGPVLYRGVDNNNGNHSFLIEGIDGNEVWINWGWGHVLTKVQLSLCNVGSYQFDTSQAAVFGVKPNKPTDTDYSHYLEIALRLITNFLETNATSSYGRNSIEDDFEEIPIQYTFTNNYEDATFDIGFLVENTETNDEVFYPLFTRTLTGFRTSTANLSFSFGKNLGDGDYRLYGASRETGSDEIYANYNKTSKYIEFTIYDNHLYFGEIGNQQTNSLLDYTYANGSEYKLYGNDIYTDTKTNYDGVVFNRRDLLLDIKKNGVTSTYMVDKGGIYYAKDYRGMMYPSMLLDFEHDKMYVFHNSKDDDIYYGMKGYIYTSPISSINFNRETIFTHANCGWFPYFTGTFYNNYPELHHFSFAGYYEMLSKRENDQWATNMVSRMQPDEAERDARAHSAFLVIGDNKESDEVANYCPNENEDEYKVLSVDSDVSGEFTIPETISGKAVTGIASYAFSTCGNITSIIIPTTITSIDEYAFGSSQNLQSIKVMSPEPIDLSYFYDNGEEGNMWSENTRLVMTPFELIDKSTCTLYVPRGSRDAYALAIGWGDFENIEEHDDTNAIEVIQQHEYDDIYWYSISGVRYRTKPTAKGVYIHNGKKFIVK